MNIQTSFECDLFSTNEYHSNIINLKSNLTNIINKFHINSYQLSNILKVSESQILDIIDNKSSDLSNNDIISIESKIYFLENGFSDTEPIEHIKALAEMILDMYEISVSTLSLYLGISEEDLNKFLNNESIDMNTLYKLSVNLERFNFLLNSNNF